MISAILNDYIRKWNKTKQRLLNHEDPETVHDLRVASRRLRAALKLFRKKLPKRAETIEAELKWLGGKLGEKRDLDVFLSFIKHHRQTSALTAQIRKAARRAALPVRLKRLRLLEEKLSGLLREQKVKQADISLKMIRRKMKRMLKEAERAAARLGPSSSDKELHALRIKLKRLRYSCEIVMRLSKNSRFEKLIRRTAELQDVLGTHQDMVRHEAILRRHGRRPAESMLQKIRAEKKKSRKIFFRLWRENWRKDVRALEVFLA